VLKTEVVAANTKKGGSAAQKRLVFSARITPSKVSRDISILGRLSHLDEREMRVLQESFKKIYPEADDLFESIWKT
jgi:hypothetical protein